MYEELNKLFHLAKTSGIYNLICMTIDYNVPINYHYSLTSYN